MKQEEMNTQLYEKLAAEQTKYRDWLMGQPPEEILNHAYEYAVREDILAAAELMDIPQAQAAALLAVVLIVCRIKKWTAFISHPTGLG